MAWIFKSEVGIFCVIFLSCTTVVRSQSVRLFPPLFNGARGRPLSTVPTPSVCGVPTRSAFCRSSPLSSSFRECRQDYCVQDCPRRTVLPDYVDLLEGSGFDRCVSTDLVNTRPGSVPPEASVAFGPGSGCYLTPRTIPSVGPNGAFTLTFWIWQDPSNLG